MANPPKKRLALFLDGTTNAVGTNTNVLKSFGPLMRFVWGAGYAARAVTRSVFANRREPR